MNGIEALHQAMNDPKLEISWGGPEGFVTWVEVIEGGTFAWNVLVSDDWQVRKRQTNLIKAVEEMEYYHANELKFDNGQSNTGTKITSILSKYIKD